MSEDTVQIKEEPLDIICAAEIADIGDASVGATTIVSDIGRSFVNKSSVYGAGRGACYIPNENGIASIMEVGLSNNVVIKIEPEIDAYAAEMCSGEYVSGCGGITAQELLEEHRKEMADVQVKEEPLEDIINYDSNGFVLPQNTSNASNTASGQTPRPDFKVVDEHENFITISAADLSSENSVLELKQKLQAIKDLRLPINLPQRLSKKSITCKLCAKRCYQDSQFIHHMEQHRRNRIFCVRKMCDSWFGSMEDCERHEFEAHDILQLKCNVCNHKFRDFEQLSEHKVKMHSKLHRFVCSLCRDWFISIPELQEHWSVLPNLCGRLANIDVLTKSYKFKSAPIIDMGGLKLRLQPVATAQKSAHLNNNEHKIDIEIKQEPMDLESNSSEHIIQNKVIENPADKYQVAATSKNNSNAAPQLKLRLRKQPLSPTRPKAASSSAPAIQNNSNALGILLAQRITSKFSLKTVPRMFNLTNKVNEIKEQLKNVPIQPEHNQKQEQVVILQPQQKDKEQQQKVSLQPNQQQQLKEKQKKEQQLKEQQHEMTSIPKPIKQFQIYVNKTNNSISVVNEPPSKVLKLPPNLKIVAHPLPTQQPQTKATTTTFHTLTKISPSQIQPQAAIGIKLPALSTNAPTEQPTMLLPNYRQFALQSVEIPSLDKQVAVAKLEAVTKANKELTLTELLDEVIVREKSNILTSTENVLNINSSTTKSGTVEEMMLQQQQCSSLKRAEEIKTEFIENMMETLQNDDSLSATNFSESSLGSNSIPSVHTNLENDSGDPPHQRSRSLPAKGKANEKSVPNIPVSESGDYICPRCSRRYSLAVTVQEHLSSNCGRNLRHKCEVCHKSFFSRSTLNCHRTVHTGILPHKCNYCDKRFRTRGQVTVHHRTHTGERPFVCEICSQSFTHRETLISHLSRHIGMKRYKCYGCNKHFSCISGLSTHRAARPDTCGKFQLNTRAIGPRVRVIRGRVVFEPQPDYEDSMDDGSPMDGVNTISADKETNHQTEVLAEIQNK